MRICWISFVALAFRLAHRSRAEYDPAFDLDTCVGGAQLIVSGVLDGADRLTIARVFRGDVGGLAVIPLSEGGWVFQRTIEGTITSRPLAFLERTWRRCFPSTVSMEVVAFLSRGGDKKWDTSGGSGNVVWLRDDGVYPFDGWSFAALAPRYDRASFFAALEESVRTAAERTRLVASARSPERAAALMQLALAHDRLPPPMPDDFFIVPFYHLAEIAKGFENPSPEEQALIVASLRAAKTDGDKTKLLQLAGLIPLHPDAFDALAEFIGRSNSPGVRKAAIGAIAMVDAWRAEDVLAPFLTLDEPQLKTVLENLAPYNQNLALSDAPEPIVNRALVEPLMRLGRELHAERERRIKEGTSNHDLMSDLRLSTLTGQLEHFQHPQFVCLLTEWALAPDDLWTWPARHALDNITKATITSDNLATWATWWLSARPLLAASYDLQSDAGRAAWMAAWSQGDKYVRPILMNLWNYEPQIDEGALLAIAEQPAAAATLSELWRRKRLTAETQKALVERFLKLSLFEEPPWDPPEKWAAHREVMIQSETAFPFPPSEGVEYRHRIEIADEPKQPTEADLLPGYSASGWGTETPRVWGAVGEGYRGKPKARGVLEMRAVDYRHDRRVLWKLVWQLGPLQLRDGGL